MKANAPKRKVFTDAVDLLMGDCHSALCLMPISEN